MTMRESKKRRLEKKGWRIAGTKEFLGSDRESRYTELKLKSSQAFKNKRQQKN